MHKLMITLGIGVLLAMQSVEAVSAQTTQLNWVGCGITKKAFMGQLARAYEAKTGIKINLQGGGASKGIRNVKAISADMGGTCRHKIVDSTQETGVRLIPVAWDALVAITHRDNPVQNLTLKQLRGVFEGRINNWSQLGGPDQPIALYVRQGTESGVGHTLRRLLFREPGKPFSSAARTFPSSGPLEQAVEGNPYSLAVTGISSARKRDLKVLRLEGRKPTYANISNGSYLLYRPLYVAINPRNPNAAAVKKFVNFALSREGREVIRGAGTVPYFDALALIRKTADQRLGQLL